MVLFFFLFIFALGQRLDRKKQPTNTHTKKQGEGSAGKEGKKRTKRKLRRKTNMYQPLGNEEEEGGEVGRGRKVKEANM